MTLSLEGILVNSQCSVFITINGNILIANGHNTKLFKTNFDILILK